MHRSGITVTQELKAAFNDASESTGFLIISLAGEQFVLSAKEDSVGDLDANFRAAAGALKDSEPAYVLTRNGDKWIMVYFVPENAHVKSKMMYASSRSSLKEGLGAQQFQCDFFITAKNELNAAEYEQSQTQGDLDHLRTIDEIVKREAEAESFRAATGTVKLTAMSDIPIKLDEHCTSAIQGFVAGTNAVLILSLDPKTEVLSASAEAKASTSEIVTKLSLRDPAFVLQSYAHKNRETDADATANVFTYYCPDSAAPRQKMFYSSTKSMVIKVLETEGIELARNLEVSEPNELTDDYIMEELYPVVAEKVKFSKPERQGRGKARLRKKFVSPTASN